MAIQIAFELDPLHRGSREEQMREMAMGVAGIEWACHGDTVPRSSLARTGFNPEPYMRRVLRTSHLASYSRGSRPDDPA
jgi:hypothetical protein